MREQPLDPVAPTSIGNLLLMLLGTALITGAVFWQKWLLLPGGLLLILLAIRYVKAISSSRERMERLVVERTAELNQIKEKLQLVLDGIPVRVHWKDRNSVYMGCNRRFAEDAELTSPEEIVGKTDYDLPWKEYAELYRERDRKVIESGQPMLNYEQPRKASDGRILCLLQSKLPLRDAQGNIIGVLSAYEDITQRKKDEQSLRENEARYRAVVENSADGIAVSVENKLVYVNLAAVRLAGVRDESDLLGRSVTDFVHEEYQAEVEKRRMKSLETSQPSPIMQSKLQRPDGRSIDAESRGVPIQYGGRPAVLYTFRDITERKQAEEALRQSREELRERAEELETIMGNAPVALWVAHDAECNYISGNKMAMSFDEASPQVNWSANVSSALHWFCNSRELKAEELPMQKAARENRAVPNMEMELLLQSGKRVSLLGSAMPLRDPQGRVRGCVGAFMDITEGKRIEQALRQSQERLSLVVEAAEIGTWDWDLGNGQLLWSPRCLTLYGLEHEAAMSYERFLKAIHPEDRERVDKAVHNALDTRGYYNVEMRTLWPDGSLHWVVSRGRAYYDDTSRPVRMSGAALDITARKNAQIALQEAHDQLAQANVGLERKVQERTAELVRANERLQELDRLKSQFLATMSHELRTPLNSIIGFTGILRQEFAGPINEEQKKQLGLVFGSAKHLLSLINDLLDLSRIEAGKVDLDHEPFNFVDVVNEVVQNLTPMARQKNLNVVADLPGAPIEMVGDRKRCFQILLNLANNAVKFTDAGQVTITAIAEPDRLRVCVADTGIGIKAEQIGTLFEAFRQLDGSAKRIYEGTGLGLHLCRKLVTLMHGQIGVESEFGKGSRFTFTLPRRIIAGPAAS